jgi:hypothetical protein
MESKSPESGLEELLRLSREITKVEQEQTREERKRAETGKTVKELKQGLKEINISVALDQLKPIATSEIIKEIDSLKSKQNTVDLRKLILGLSTGLEKMVDSTSGPNLDMASIERSAKTLVILIELLFSIE